MSDGLFAGFDIAVDEDLPEDCVKFLHGDGRVDVFRIEGEHATRMVVSPTGKVFDPESVAGRFWIESARRKQLEEEAAKARPGVEHFEAMLRLVWTGDNMAALFRGEPIRFGPQDLDEWLAEDNPHRLTHYRVPGVLEALGLA